MVLFVWPHYVPAGPVWPLYSPVPLTSESCYWCAKRVESPVLGSKPFSFVVTSTPFAAGVPTLAAAMF